MKKVYTINIRLLSAMHINAGTAPDSKRVFVRYDGRPYIPATLLKGMVRGNFSMLMNTFAPDDIGIADDFFGSEGYDRSHCIFDNLFSGQSLGYENRANVSIDRYTRKNSDKALVFSEVVSCMDNNGEPVVLSGEATVYYTDEMLHYEKVFLESVRMINFIGSGKSRGLGYVEAEINEKAC